MHHHDYAPLLAAHPLFIEACQSVEHSSDALAILATATWLSDRTFEAMQRGVTSVEVAIGPLEIAAGVALGSTIAQIAGYSQHTDGRFYSHGAQGAEYLPVPENSLYQFLTNVREEI